MKKQNIAIIAVVAFVLAVAVGYALFRETITINGTATAKGNFDIQITDAVISGGEGYATEVEGTTVTKATVATDKNSVDLAAELQYPGAYVEYTITVKNAGTIDAILKAINESAAYADADEAPVVVSYPTLPTKDATLAANATDTVVVRVEWDADDELAADANSKSVNVEADYTISFDYEQITVQ